VARPGWGASQPSEKPPLAFTTLQLRTRPRTHPHPAQKPPLASNFSAPSRCAAPAPPSAAPAPPTTALLPRPTVLVGRLPSRNSNRRPRDRRARQPAPAPCRARSVCRSWLHWRTHTHTHDHAHTRTRTNTRSRTNAHSRTTPGGTRTCARLRLTPPSRPPFFCYRGRVTPLRVRSWRGAFTTSPHGPEFAAVAAVGACNKKALIVSTAAIRAVRDIYARGPALFRTARVLVEHAAPKALPPPAPTAPPPRPVSALPDCVMCLEDRAACPRGGAPLHRALPRINCPDSFKSNFRGNVDQNR
jgi:hypothetical protein